MKYFLFANTEKKPVMRFFDHWFEVSDFLTIMNWDYLQGTPYVEIYHKMEDRELNEKHNGK
jgi:hypothetical protein